MSGNQRTLQVFGIIEIVLGFFNAFNAIWGTGRWSAVGLNAITAVALINAAKDPSKIMPAWVITLVNLVFSVLVLAGGYFIRDQIGTVNLVSVGIALVLNLIVFLAANGVKKQSKR